MLLRSASTPLLNSWIPHTKDASPDPESFYPGQKNRPVLLTASNSSPFSPISDDSMKRITRTSSESDLKVVQKRPLLMNGIGISIEEEKIESLNDGYGFDFKEECEGEKGYFGNMGCDSFGGNFGGNFGGKYGGNDDGFWDSNNGNDSTDLYYQKMIEANPGNSLLLSNYAKFLKEVRGDYVKAEEYCGRAILMNPNDGDTLSMYADLIWQSQKDASRAESYFDQAVKAAPDDCYVLASYAHFLWDAEDEEEEDEVNNVSSQSNLFNGASQPIAATS